MVLQAYPEDLAVEPSENQESNTKILKYYYVYQVPSNHETNPVYVLAIVAMVAIAGIIIYALSKK